MSDQTIRDVFSIAGLVIGFYTGNPALGYFIGTLLGEKIAGPREGPVGPRLEDLKIASADYGAPLPKVFGSMRVPGQMIWSQPYKEHVHEETVGDSFLTSGTTVTTYSYTASFACAVGDGPIVGVRRVWANGKLVYDASSKAAYDALIRRTVTISFLHDHLTTYAVGIDQGGVGGDTLETLAANIESARSDLRAEALGGNRLQIYARDFGQTFTVTTALSADENGNSAPAWAIDVTDEAHTRDAALVESARWATYMRVYTGTESQTPDPTMEAVEGEGNVPAYRGTPYLVFTDLPLANWGNGLPRIEAEVVSAGSIEGETVTRYLGEELGGFALSGGPSGVPSNFGPGEVVYNTTPGPDDPGWSTSREEVLRRLGIGFNQFVSYALPGEAGNPALSGQSPFTPAIRDNAVLGRQAVIGLAYVNVSPMSGAIDSTDPCDPRIGNDWSLMRDGTIRRRRLPGEPQTPGTTGYACGGLSYEWTTGVTISMRIRPVTPPSTCSEPGSPCSKSPPVALVPGTDGQWCIDCQGNLLRNLNWAPTTGNFRQLQTLTYADTSKLKIQKRAVGLVVPEGDPRYDDQNFWQTQASAHGVTGTYGVDFPVQLTEAYVATFVDSWLEPNPESLSQVVSTLCQSAGLSPAQIDVSALVGAVNGYAVTRPMAARSALEPLAAAYEFDAVERDGVLVFRHRGGAPDASLGPADLGAGAEGEAQPSLSIDRVENNELPRSVSVFYSDTSRDYQPQTQRSSRQQAGKVDLRLSLPMALSDTQAAALAERTLWRAWAEREAISTAVLRKWARLEPADVLNLDDGETQREARILRTRHAGGRVVLEMVSQQQAVFDLARAGQAGRGSRASIGFSGPSSLLWVDSAMVSDADDSPGAYVVVSGAGDAWGGAAVYRSLDAGKNWNVAATTDVSAALARCTTVLPDRKPTLFWPRDTLDLVVLTGDYAPASVSQADLFNGANRALVGNRGRWELIGWQTAQQVDHVTWRLTGLLRGLRGTEWVADEHFADDWFLPVEMLTRINAEAASIGVERQFRAVTFGHSLAAAGTETEILQAVGLKPYAPVHVRARRASNGDLTLRWLRRTRTGGDWLDDADAPLGEAANSWEVDILSSAGIVLRTLSEPNMLSVPQSVTYTAAQQVTDFGTTQSAIKVRIYQISEVVGRGYPAEATL